MKRLVAIASLLVVSACGSIGSIGSGTGVASPTLSLERCDEASAEEQTAEFPPSAPPGLYLFCGNLDMPSGASLPVGVVGDQPAEVFEGRELLVYHPGGPGISTVEVLIGDPPPVDYGRYAVVAWDGATASARAGACGDAGDAYGATDRDAEAARSVAEECFVDVDGVGGAWGAALELEALRSTIFVQRFDLLTHSYGTAVAEAYMRLWPQHVGKAVLDGPIALEAPWEARIAAVGAALDAVVDTFIDTCALPECAAAEAGAGYEALRTGLAEAAPYVGVSSLRLSATAIDQATLLALRSEQYWPALEEAFSGAGGGDGMGLNAMSDRYYFGLDREVFYQALCSDIDHPSDPERYLVTGSPLLVAYASELAPCAFLDRQERPEVAKPVAAAAPEVLVVASPYDVLTPAGLFAQSGRLRAIASLCTTDVLGHTSFASQTVQEIVAAFLADGDGAGAAARCRAEWSH